MSDIGIDFTGIVGAFFGLLATLISFFSFTYFTIRKRRYRRYQYALNYFGMVFFISLAALLIFPLADDYPFLVGLLKWDDRIFPFLSVALLYMGYRRSYGKVNTAK